MKKLLNGFHRSWNRRKTLDNHSSRTSDHFVQRATSLYFIILMTCDLLSFLMMTSDLKKEYVRLVHDWCEVGTCLGEVPWKKTPDTHQSALCLSHSSTSRWSFSTSSSCCQLDGASFIMFQHDLVKLNEAGSGSGFSW